MSNSTIFIKKPLNCRQSLALLKEKYKEYSPELSPIMWISSGLYAVSQSNFNTSLTGIVLSFPVYGLLLMFLSSVLLLKGLRSKNILLLVPWISVTVYSLYYHHYLGLLNTLTTLKHVKKVSWLPWCNLIVNIFLMVVRGTLTVRIFQLYAHLWFKKKITEMKEKHI